MKSKRRKTILLGVRTFYRTSFTHLQSYLPCLNPLKKGSASGVRKISIPVKKIAASVGCRHFSRWVVGLFCWWRWWAVEKGQPVDHFWPSVFILNSLNGIEPLFSLPPKNCQSGAYSWTDKCRIRKEYFLQCLRCDTRNDTIWRQNHRWPKSC